MNGAHRATASGLEVLLAHMADLILRRNIRIVNSPGPHRKPLAGFKASLHASHHVELCNEINILWNTLCDMERSRGVTSPYETRPVMQQVDSDETFGLAPNLLPSTKTEDPDDAVYSLKEDDDMGLDDETAAALVSAVERRDIKASNTGSEGASRLEAIDVDELDVPDGSQTGGSRLTKHVCNAALRPRQMLIRRTS